MECFICKDKFNAINKICVCNDSFICNECLELSNINHMKKCPICRANLNFDKKINYLKHFLLIFSEILFQILIYTTPLIMLFYLNYYNNLDITTFNITTIAFLIIFLEPMNIYFFEKLFYLNYKSYQVMKSVCMMMCTLIFLFILGSEISFKWYFMTVLFPFYYLPAISGSSFLICQYLTKLKDFNDTIITENTHIKYNIVNLI